jgi:hypothetical protein
VKHRTRTGLALARECRIYSIKAAFTAGTVYTETPNDSTIPGVLATLDTTLGTFTPKAIGFGKPTGLLYLP